ncbi:MAG: M4 family metallopeptidase [Bacteroidetes bacterium]|nr:M4 family metallopeptidase [Bacteroidota bacterium]
MKNHVLRICAIFLFTAMFAPVSGQNSPFAVKSKSLKTAGFWPTQVQPIPGLSPSTSVRMTPAQSWRPVSHPLPSISPSRSTFGEKYYNDHGQVIFLTGKLLNPTNLDLKSGSNLELACFEYLEAIQADLRIRDARREFKKISVQTDELGITHVKMQQIYQGIPVYGGEIFLHTTDNQIGLFNGNVYPTFSASNVVPSVSAYQAKLTVTADVSKRTNYRELNPGQKMVLHYDEPVSELVIYARDRDPGKQFLAWHITIRPNFLERWEYFVDAGTGSVLHGYNNTQTDGDVTATGADLNGVSRTIHAYLQGSSYLMVDVSKPMYNPQNQEGTMRIYDANYSSPSSQGFNPAIASSPNNTWGAKVISAQYNAGVTYEYFRATHNKNSWNDKGGSILSVINAAEENGSGMDNAYWNGVCIVYGNGATQFKPLAGALDVSAHELGHAYDEASANLEYQNQSGAMNEAFSDIAGSVVERLNWKIGEDVVKPGSFPTGCLRDMSNPHNGGSGFGDPGYQPANVSEMYTGTQDNGGVHINSGIINFAFYKYATAVGMAKGEKTFFKALFQYLTRSSQFIDCRLAVIQSAKDLYGDGSAEVNAAKAAFDEVGIMDGNGGNYQNQLPVNPGQDYIMAYNTATSDPNTLYVSTTTASSFLAISQTPLINKPSIVDNGSVAVFIGSDKKMHSITLGAQPEEATIQPDPVWSNIAISKDGTMIAAVTEFQDSAIWIYSFQKAEWVIAHLYNPTTQEGVVTNNVLYADALEWDYSGEFIMYDAYNQMNSSSSGQNVDYWDISFMQVWNKSSSDWGTGEVFKLVSGIPEGISIGNPSLSKNSPAVCAFDYFDASTFLVNVLAANLETGDFVDVYSNGTALSYPNYSKLDDKIIFSSLDNGTPVIRSIAMSSDKVHPATTSAPPLISEAKWGVWFTQGTRTLGIAEPNDQAGMRIYPNPVSDKVHITFERNLTAPVTIEISDIRGIPVKSAVFPSSEGNMLDLSGVTPGFYLVKATGKDFSVTQKIVVQ